MKIDVRNVSRDGAPVDADVCGADIGELRPDISVADTVHFAGWVTRTGDAVMVQGSAKGTYLAMCSRCLAAFGQEFSVSVAATYVVETATNEPGRELRGAAEQPFRYDGTEIDPVPAVRAELILDAPVKPLCSPECRGLCAGCGVDLNKESCKCETQPVDPRLAALKDILLGQQGE